MAAKPASVELGFAEKCPPEQLLSQYFPNKIGGCPAWLGENNLPNRCDLLCKICGQPLMFLLQVNCDPIEDESTCHRMIYLFLCTNVRCCKRFENRNFTVLRRQMPEMNDSDGIEKTVPPADKNQQCSVCGCAASVKCATCCEVCYCSENRRDSEWKLNHQSVCGKNITDMRTKERNSFLLPEYEIVFETEELPTSGPEKPEHLRMKEFTTFMKSAKAPKEFQNMPLDELDAVMQMNDKAFNKFQKKIKLEPDQVLRYERGGSPLWVSGEHVPSAKDIPDCVCGAKRVFEFQVMPQLLNYLSLDSLEESIDWGTLAVYTCSKSCQRGAESYVEEFLWKQDF